MRNIRISSFELGKWLLRIINVLVSMWCLSAMAATNSQLIPRFESGSLPASAEILGQSASLLPDGRWLLSGGVREGKAVSALTIYNPITLKSAPVKVPLSHARAFHSSTLLPDGSVFVFGGVDENNNVLASAELFDVATGKLTALPNPGLLATSHHNAVMLTDGKLLILSGLSAKDAYLANAEKWDPRTGQVSSVDKGSKLARSDTTSRLSARTPKATTPPSWRWRTRPRPSSWT